MTSPGPIPALELGELVVAEEDADAHPRPPRSGDTPYALTMPTDGRCTVEQHGRRARLNPLDMALHDTGRPHTVLPEEHCRTLTLTFPRHALRLPPERLGRLTATRLDGSRGVPALLSTLLTGLPAAAGHLSATQAVRLADAVLGLLDTALAERLAEHTGTDPADPADTVGRRALLLRMQAFAEEHLADADLSPSDIAAAVHVSIGYLHKVFRAEGTTAARWIRAQRLEHCRRDLTAPAGAALPVGEVAARWGFVDAAHFSKLFKNTYGSPPREYRILHELEPDDGRQ